MNGPSDAPRGLACIQCGKTLADVSQAAGCLTCHGRPTLQREMPEGYTVYLERLSQKSLGGSATDSLTGEPIDSAVDDLINFDVGEAAALVPANLAKSLGVSPSNAGGSNSPNFEDLTAPTQEMRVVSSDLTALTQQMRVVSPEADSQNSEGSGLSGGQQFLRPTQRSVDITALTPAQAIAAALSGAERPLPDTPDASEAISPDAGQASAPDVTPLAIRGEAAHPATGDRSPRSAGRGHDTAGDVTQAITGLRPATLRFGPSTLSGAKAQADTAPSTASASPPASGGASASLSRNLTELANQMAQTAPSGAAPAPWPPAVVTREDGSLSSAPTQDGTSANNEDLVGKMLGDYRLQKLAGMGGMATVYKAVDTKIGRTVALKVLLPDLAQRDPASHARLMREARTSAVINHPNVVTLFQVGCDRGRDFLVMEWVGGGSVQERVQQDGPLTTHEAVQLMIQACQGVQAAHAAGIIHRDIKPNNLMLTEGGVVKVADFGLAKQEAGEQSLTQAGSFLGTPQYMAPELWRGAESTPRSDVYALGATLFYLLAGQPPFKGTVYTLVLSHTQRPVPNLQRIRADLPADVAAVIQTAMAKDPAMRYPDAGAMAAALQSLMVSGAVGHAATATPPSHAMVTGGVIGSSTINNALSMGAGGRPQINQAALAALDVTPPDEPFPAAPASSAPASGGGGALKVAIALLSGLLLAGVVFYMTRQPVPLPDVPSQTALKSQSTDIKPPLDTLPNQAGEVLAKPLVVSLNVQPPNVEITALGEPDFPALRTARGDTQRRLELPPGGHMLVFGAPGYIPQAHVVVGPPDGRYALEVRLLRLREADANDAKAALPELEAQLRKALEAPAQTRGAALMAIMADAPDRTRPQGYLNDLAGCLAQYPAAELTLPAGVVTSLETGRATRNGGGVLRLSVNQAVVYTLRLPDPMPLIRTDKGWQLLSDPCWDRLVSSEFTRAQSQVAQLLENMADWSSPQAASLVYSDPAQASKAQDLQRFLAGYLARQAPANSASVAEFLRITQRPLFVAFGDGLTRAVARVETTLTVKPLDRAAAAPQSVRALLDHELSVAGDGRWRVVSTRPVVATQAP